MLSNETLIHETSSCPHISPTIMSYGFLVWNSGYGLRLVGVCLLSLTLCLKFVRLLSVRFISWSENVNGMTEKLDYKTRLGGL